jgi:hypothetical protein
LLHDARTAGCTLFASTTGTASPTGSVARANRMLRKSHDAQIARRRQRETPLSGGGKGREGGPEDQGRKNAARREIQTVFFMGSGVGQRQPTCPPPKTTSRLRPARSDSRGCGVDEERRRKVEVMLRLQSTGAKANCDNCGRLLTKSNM